MDQLIYKTYLGKRGYIIRKKYFDTKILNEIRKDLTVKPFTIGDFNNNEEFKVYRENENKLYLPKFYALDKIGVPEYSNIPTGIDIYVKFIGNLRQIQKLCVDTYLSTYKKNSGGGIIVLECGQGKTVTAIKILSELKKRTLIIVHKEFLMNQWEERLNQFLDNPKIGRIQQKIFDINGKDIVLGMLQTIAMKDFPLDAFDSFGTVIIDEAHRIPSKVFSRALNKINAENMIGLTATPNRKDGMTKVLKWYIGDIIFSVKNKKLDDVFVERYIINSDTIDNYNKEYIIPYNGSVKMATMINNIASYIKRTNLILSTIQNIVKTDRQILLLSDRKDQLNYIFDKVTDNNICSVGYYVGGMKQAKLKDSETKQLILATYPMANEGLDIPTLNTLILATPKSDIIQSIGRIMRKKHDEYPPLILDFIDTFSIFDNQANKRLKIFTKNNYMIKNIYYDLNKNEKISEEIIDPSEQKDEYNINTVNKLLKTQCMFGNQ